MKLNTVVNRFILKEMMAPFAISIVFFTFVFMMTKILNITNYIVNYRIGITTVAMILAYSMPRFFEFVIPISVMMAVLLTFLRMSNDNEIIALKAGGISVYGLIRPVFLFCLAGCLLTGFMTIHAEPWGRLSIRDMKHQIKAANIDVVLRERTFNDSFEGVVFYVNQYDPKTRTCLSKTNEIKTRSAPWFHPRGGCSAGRTAGPPGCVFTMEPSIWWTWATGPSTRFISTRMISNLICKMPVRASRRPRETKRWVS
jgi:hypothetical protein